MERERPYLELQPNELNAEFHKLFGLVSALPISLSGVIIGEEGEEMIDDERAFYNGILQSLKDYEDPDLILANPYAEMMIEEIEASLGDDQRIHYIQGAIGDAAKERRMTFGATLLVKLEKFIPFVKGTDSFKEYIRREFKRCIRDGTENGGRGHWLYGDDELGGVFHPESVVDIEERSFQIFSQDIAWYGVSPFVGRVFEADYDNDPVYGDMVDLGRKWKPEFIGRYDRIPLNVHGQEIQIP